MFKKKIPPFEEVVKLYETMIDNGNNGNEFRPGTKLGKVLNPIHSFNHSVSDNDELFDILSDIGSLVLDCMTCIDDPQYAVEMACHYGLAYEDDEFIEDELNYEEICKEIINDQGETIAKRLQQKGFSGLHSHSIMVEIEEVVVDMLHNKKLDYKHFAVLLNTFLKEIHLNYTVTDLDAERLLIK